MSWSAATLPVGIQRRWLECCHGFILFVTDFRLVRGKFTLNGWIQVSPENSSTFGTFQPDLAWATSDYRLGFWWRLQFPWQRSEDEVELVVSIRLVDTSAAASPQQPQLEVRFKHLQQLVVAPELWKKAKLRQRKMTVDKKQAGRRGYPVTFSPRSACSSVCCALRRGRPRGGAAWCHSPGHWSPRAPPPLTSQTNAPSAWGEAAGRGHRRWEDRKLQEVKGQPYF